MPVNGKDHCEEAFPENLLLYIRYYSSLSIIWLSARLARVDDLVGD